MTQPRDTSAQAQDEAVSITSELIRIDTSNTGEPETTVGERAAADYVAGQLEEVGYEVTRLDSGGPGRSNVFVRIEGADPSRSALLVHGHLDVVPADPTEWSVHPFSGAIQDGYIWGRGAVDMKDMVGMMLAVARRFRRDGIVPPRDLVFAFLADEEAGGAFGSQWLVKNRADLFDGVTEAVGEVGGFSITLGDDLRAYTIEIAEKGIAWMRLRVRGTAGHGSMLHDDNAVTKLSAAVGRLGEHQFPIVVTDSVRAFLNSIAALTGAEFDKDDLAGSVAKLGSFARAIGATLRDTANPTMLTAGYKANVIPSVAEAVVDCRVLPGREAAFERELDEILGPDVEREWVTHLPAVETTFDGDLVDAMTTAVVAEDPGAHTIPYMLSGGTDAKAFQDLGIRCFGFSPLRLPPDLDFSALFHGVDERVPVEAVRFGTRVLDRFLRNC
ncbi:MAG TPA: M20/M25/M40 family metallo-hydrolase [Actinophytocola sp.]|uniref:M20/M25/M40 family metallo-hydrolase n=1 Tax=Actinophytocola sp. TaxID=1872138 RepID=UPI002F950E29